MLSFMQNLSFRCDFCVECQCRLPVLAGVGDVGSQKMSCDGSTSPGESPLFKPGYLLQPLRLGLCKSVHQTDINCYILSAKHPQFIMVTVILVHLPSNHT